MCLDASAWELQKEECKKYCLWYLICISIPYLILFVIWAVTGGGEWPWLFAAGVAGFCLGIFVIIMFFVQVPFCIYFWITSYRCKWWCRHRIEDCERCCVWLCCRDNNVSRQPQLNDNPQIPIDTGNPKITLDIEGQIYRIELNGNQNNIKLDTCSICLEKTIEKPQDCGHVFHKKCLDKWLMKEKSCPNCRKDIRKS